MVKEDGQHKIITMSATNRGTKRIESDFYPTPLKSFTPLIQCLALLQPIKIWEPACGDRRLIEAMRNSSLEADGDDLNNGYDFLKDETFRQCIVTNPPYSIAAEFVEHAVNLSPHVFLLLRLGFLGAQKRRGWFQLHEPALFVLSERPSFAKSVSCKDDSHGPDRCRWKALIPAEAETPKACPTCGGKVKVTNSDSSEYAWFYWGNRFSGVFHL